MSDRSVTILIVGYRRHDLLAACLESARHHLPDLPVLVWDNSGPDQPELDALIEQHPEVSWHRSPVNIGFAAAVNRLAALAGDSDILLLNPDAVLVSPLTETLQQIRRSGTAAVAPLAYESDDRRPPTGHPDRYLPWDAAHRRLTLPRAFASRAGYAERLRGTWFSDLYRHRPDEVDGYLTGACLVMSRAALDAVGPLDEEFFLYGEEADWQARARAAGWRLRLVAEPGVVHSGQGTAVGDRQISRRSEDLLHANVALNIERALGVRRSNLFLAGSVVLDRVQRSVRTRRKLMRTDGTGTGRPAIVITTNRLVIGGAERQHIVLATELTRRGYDVTIVCMQRLGPLVAEIPPDVRVLRQPWWAPVIDLPPGRAVLVSGDTNTETGFATLWRRLHPSRRWLVAAHTPPKPEQPTYSRALAAAMRAADGFVALSPRHWEELTRHQDLGPRWHTAPNGVASAADLQDVPPRAPVDESRPLRLVMLARIVEHKNPHLLVEALDGLRDRRWELSIFGDGVDRARLQALTPDALADRVRWRGWARGPQEALAECDLLCVPSRAEAFPLVILEAMARRIPVAASAVCSVPDMLDGGTAGMLVQPVDVPTWRATLSAALDDRSALAQIGQAGFARMSALYTVEAMADAYEAAFERVLAGGDSPRPGATGAVRESADLRR